MTARPLPLPDLSKPPPGFPPGFAASAVPAQPPPLMSLPLKPPQDTELMPSMPYYDLPAGLMAPLVKVMSNSSHYYDVSARNDNLYSPYNGRKT